MKNLIHLRGLQALRMIKATGIGMSILALFLLAGVILGFIEKMLSVHQIYSIIATLIIILTIDKVRTDKHFLSQTLGGNISMGSYLSIEYLLLLSPLIIYKLVNGHYLIFCGIIVTTVVLAYVSTQINKVADHGYKQPISWIPLKYFELKFFYEKRRISFTLILSLLFLGTIHVSLWILGIFLLMGYIMEIFAPLEPKEMITWRPKFVGNKIIQYSAICLPLLTATGLLTYMTNELSIWVFIYGICVIITAIALAISNKYAEYYGLTDRIKSTLPITIISFFMIIPGFILITIGYTILKYKKAESQMKLICSR